VGPHVRAIIRPGRELPRIDSRGCHGDLHQRRPRRTNGRDHLHVLGSILASDLLPFCGPSCSSLVPKHCFLGFRLVHELAGLSAPFLDRKVTPCWPRSVLFGYHCSLKHQYDIPEAMYNIGGPSYMFGGPSLDVRSGHGARTLKLRRI
jgi:hypothetical protein